MKTARAGRTTSGELTERKGRSPATSRHPLIRLPVAALDRASVVAGHVGLAMLQCGLAVVFVWFGVLKITGHSDVYALIGVTVPIVSPHFFVPALGVVETLLGIGLLIPKARRLVLLGLCVHLTGTFLTFLDAPGWMFHGADPLLLTVDGEFVLKNVVLISAAVALLGLTGHNRVPAVPRPRPAADARAPRTAD